VPEAATSAGLEAVELAADAGLVLDEWQQAALVDALGEREDGKWAAFEVGLIVPRQNGKGSILEARELAGLFLFGERLILHSAHEFKTASEAFRRVLGLVQSTPDLDRRVLRVRTSHGDEGIELRGGQRLRFVARSTGSGRGFSGDCVILDEAYHLSMAAMAALLPTMSARPNPQLWYTSSAPLPEDRSDVLRSLCKRGRSGSSPRLAYMEFCADAGADLADRAGWAQANPGLGIRIAEEFVENERAALGSDEFVRERLGLWVDDEMSGVLPRWDECEDSGSLIVGRRAFAVDVSPDHRWAAIGVVGLRADGLPHGEVVAHRQGTEWLAGRLAELKAKWKPVTVVAAKGSPAEAVVPDIEAAKVPVQMVGAAEHSQACGMLFEAVGGGWFRHIGQPNLTVAAGKAVQAVSGDTWKWSRSSSSVDICPLVAVTLALWGFQTQKKAPATGLVAVDFDD
jgi:hypothetical protein